MKTKLTALVTSDRLKIAISLLAILFFAVNAWETKNAGEFGWALLCVVWVWPEKVETKTTPKDVV